MGNEYVLGRCGGQKPGSHTGEEKGAKVVGEQGKSQTSEGYRNAGHQKNPEWEMKLRTKDIISPVVLGVL